MNSLYFKLVLALFLLFATVGGLFLLLAMYTAPMYQQEVSQQLNRDLARYIVNEHVLIDAGAVRKENLDDLFANVMTINPSLELYLLDAGGRVIGHSMPPARVRLEKVSLVPIQRYLENTDTGLIMGDDPGHESRQNAFSVAPIDVDGRRQGYIYAILGSEKIEHIADVLQRSLIMRWSATVLLVALGLAFAAGALLFFFLIRKLRGLSAAMQEFRRQNLVGIDSPDSTDTDGLDEIDAMAATFEEMAHRMREQVDHLTEMESMRRNLIANVSHDLRTPLASLGGFLETLQLKADSLGEDEKRHYLSIALANAQRLNRLVGELFELAKLDANEMPPQRESFSPAELAFDVSHKFYLRARDQGIDFDVVVGESVPWVSADLGMIERVLDNLIDNAFKFTPADGRIRLEMTAAATGVRVSVSDTGSGINADELPHVVERYYRNKDQDAANSGLGLGLAIASRIVELHGSELTVESRPSAGTTFRFSLPLSA